MSRKGKFQAALISNWAITREVWFSTNQNRKSTLAA